MATRIPGGGELCGQSTTACRRRPSPRRYRFTTVTARRVYQRTCCRPSGTSSAHILTSASISRGASSSILTGPGTGAVCLPELTTLDGGGMIQLAVDCLQFGKLAVRSAPSCPATHYCAPAPAFEIIRLAGDGKGVTIARVEVERAGLPTLKIDRLPPEERGVGSSAAAVNGKVGLARGGG